MRWLGSLIGWGPQDEKTVANDLKRLNSLKAGLGDQATAYVCKGEGGTVLSSISVLSKANELEVCTLYLKDKSPTLERRRMFARAHPYPCEMMQRYTEVLLAASSNGVRLELAPGSEAVPMKVRLFFLEAFMGLADHPNSWPRTAAPLNGKGLTPEMAADMVHRLDGQLVDLFDVLFAKSGNYSVVGGELYRQAVDLRAQVAAQSAAAIAAANRIQATGRAEFIRSLVQWQLNQSRPFLEFLVAQAGDGAKAAREAATSALADAPAAMLEPLAIRVLGDGDVDQRAGMVELLGRLRTRGALEALQAHRQTERTARILAAIDTALTVAEQTDTPATGNDDARGYLAIDGRRVDVPPLRPLADGVAPAFGADDRAILQAVIAETNERTRKQNEEQTRRGYKYQAPLLRESLADRSVALLNAEPRVGQKDAGEVRQFLAWGPGANWTRSALAKLPDTRALAWAASLCGSAMLGLQAYAQGAGSGRLRDFMNSADGDLRHLEAIDVENGVEFQYGGWMNRKTNRLEKGDYLRNAIQEGYSLQDTLVHPPRDAVWPYLAENLDVFDEALGLKPQGQVRLDRAAAICMLALLPVAPVRYFAPLLEAATGTTKAGRAEARAMLGGRAEVEPRLIALLEDSRQAVRAGAAEWLAERKDPSAAAALWARLKKEKSEVARAAILTALKRLGEDLSKALGPEALIADAQKGLKGAKVDKLAWVAQNALPPLRFRDGAVVPQDVPRWWLFLAYKLKQPGGNALFGLYLDQLDLEDAATFSTWVLDTWINYDTARPSEIDANAYAKANAAPRHQAMVRYYKDYTEERAFADLRREFMSNYLHSGADAKGLLALGVRAPSALAADRTRAYLRNHGSRTSQASALLEMLAAIGDPVALQAVIAAATRLKQKGVQAFAGELVTKVAEARDWTLDELADRTIPVAGFDDNGVLTLPCGEDGKAYEARLTNELTVVLRNPAGKDVAGLPAGDDAATAASKKQLSTTKKELKQIATMQSARLYEALCAERKWAPEDWMRCFHAHPVMRRMVERVVWLGFDDRGGVAGSFRPTAEGDFTDANDAAVNIADFATVRVAHGALIDEALGKAWEQHLKDYEVKPLFGQFGRALLRIEDKDASKIEIDDRKGWLTDAFAVRGAATKLGYERGPPLDGGFFNEYRKTFASAGLVAVVEFTGNGLPEQNVPAALISLKFTKSLGPGYIAGAVKLGDVPPVLLSECWNDYRTMAAKGAFDSDWERKAGW
jgi:HEAT repeat protein